jgi:DNA-binding CsgD family transcriptional regulator
MSARPITVAPAANPASPNHAAAQGQSSGAHAGAYPCAVSTTRTAAAARSPAESCESRVIPTLAAVLEGARLRVLRVAVLIAMLITIGNLVGAIAGFTASGVVTGPAVALGAGWAMLWAVAATWTSATAWCFVRWRVTALLLAGACAATIALTGGVDSPLCSVCMYAGWIASVVVAARAALVVSLLMSAAVVVGFVVTGTAVADIVSGPHRYTSVTNVVLPLMAGVVGVLLASVTNSVLAGVDAILAGLRTGAPAATPGLTALFAERDVRALAPPDEPDELDERERIALTSAEQEVVDLLTAGYLPKQIAHMRGVSLSTVRSQIKAAKRKTGARTLAQLGLHAGRLP